MSSEFQQSSAENIINFLNESSSELVLSQSKKIILLLGDTGCGKSTLAHFLGKDNASLNSVQQSDRKYLLFDEDGKISRNTTISQTIIPELVEDIRSQITFYDCPGFNDTRSVATDIVNAYLIHKIFNHGIEFKIILVINYHSVRSGVDRKSFIELIRNVSNIIKNVRRFSHSIAAVVTKVDNTVIREGNNYNLVPDNQVLNGIAEFLHIVKREIPSNEPNYENVICLIDTFLIKTKNNYDRLGLFRRPDEEGPVKNILVLQRAKKRILNILQHNIVFATKNSTDFGYTISTESQNEIIYLVARINENISSMINAICENLISAYKTRERNTTDLHIQIKAFTIIQKNLLQLEENMREQMTLLSVSSSLIKLFYNMDEEIPQHFFTNLSNYDQQLQFLTIVSENNININPLEWINVFDDLKFYINESKEWYILLDDIFMQLSKYEIQKNKSQFRINEFESIRTGSDFINMFEMIYDGELPRYLDIIRNQVDDVKLRMLRNILIYTLDADINYITSDPEKVQIRGKYVKISDIPNDILFSTKNFIEIFALNTVFIDKDLNFEGKKQKIVIAAPEWQVINNRLIILNGEDGEQQSKANNGFRRTIHTERPERFFRPFENIFNFPFYINNYMDVCNDIKEDAEDGKPGLPGGAAGTLFGLGQIYTNLNSLLIEANGGKGGKGQDGGNGCPGKNGKNPTLPQYFNQSTSPEDQLKSIGFRFTSHSTFSDQFSKNFYFDIFGSDGECGEKGGHGGYRGAGGPKGKINIIDLRIEPRLLSYNSFNGRTGGEGIGGSGGLGGTNGNKVVAMYKYQYYVLFADPANWIITQTCSNGIQSCGDNGVNNNNTDGYQEAENPVQIENIPNIVEEYKLYLEEYLHDSIQKSHLSKFINKLNARIYNELE